jgi:hypothetical protein
MIEFDWLVLFPIEQMWEISYDSLPILEYLYQNGVKPTIIANGAKNMYIEVPGCRVRMIDFNMSTSERQ